MNRRALTRLAMTITKLVGWLFVLDGVSLIWRGFVGGLFLLHEQSSSGFLARFILHTIGGGLVYSSLGYGLARGWQWVFRVPGGIVALTAMLWGLPWLGRDHVTATLGGAYFLALILQLYARRRSSPTHGPGVA